jgi:hypothetical protein
MQKAPRVAAWIVLSACLAARGDDLEFAAGGRVQLPATIRGDEVLLEAPGGPWAFRKADFRAIVPEPRPEEAWESLRSRATAGGASARYEAAWWALMNGLTPQAAAMLRSAHDADPAQQPTARMVAALDRLTKPCPDPDLTLYRRLLPGRWRVARGPHTLVFHQHDDASAAERIDLFERVLTSYYLFFAALGFDPPPPAHRLVSAWFARQEDYLTFLRDDGADAFLTTTGYYHPTADLVVAADPRGTPPRRRAIAELAARRAEADDRARRDLDRRRLLLELECRSLDLGTAAHELVHQLVARTRLAPHHDDFPLWLHEGLAAQFEVVRGGRWAGIGQPHPLRLADWRRLATPPRLAPLVRDVGFGGGYHPGPYASAWALVDFLRREHPGQLVAFLDLLRTPDPDDSPRRGRVLSAFQAAFGPDLAPLESAWHRHVARLQAGDVAAPAGEPRPSTGGAGPGRVREVGHAPPVSGRW